MFFTFLCVCRYLASLTIIVCQLQLHVESALHLYIGLGISFPGRRSDRSSRELHVAGEKSAHMLKGPSSSFVVCHGSLSLLSQVMLYELKAGGLAVTITNYGATIVSVRMPDKHGTLEEINLNYSTLDQIVTATAYYGATVGRVANRIAGGAFTLEGQKYSVPVNNGPNSLHGGIKGFDKKVWEHERMGASGVKFTCTSEDGEEGYPGRLHVSVTYSVTPNMELKTEYSATVETGVTIVNLTNHAYWNLSGDFKEKVGGHELQLYSHSYLPVDANQIPTGEIKSVTDTEFDFTSPKSLEHAIHNIDGGGKPGLDHCFVIDKNELEEENRGDKAETKEHKMCTLIHRGSGRVIDLKGTQPGLQVYTSNWGSENASDAPHIQHNSVALETQAFPNAINESSWANQVILRAGETYKHTSTHTFRLL